MRERTLAITAAAALLFAALISIYLSCAAPGVMYGDSAELQTVALTGGIAHPTGYPTFILVGRAFGAALRGDPAHRITVMSSVFGAAGACALLAVLLELGMPLAIGVSGAVIYALSFTFFWASVRTEVYTLAILLFLIATWLAIRTLARPSTAWAALTGVFMGLALTGHLSFAPPLAILFIALILSKPPRGVSRLRHGSAIVAGCVVGLLPYLYIVWADRAGYPMNYLNYTVEPSGGQYGLTEQTFSSSWRRVAWLILGQESRPIAFLLHARPMLWQALRVLVVEFVYYFGPVGFLLFLAGLYRAARAGRRTASLLVAGMAASFLFGAGFGAGRMLPIFILPLTIGVAITISYGLWHLFEHMEESGSCAGGQGPSGGNRRRSMRYAALAAVACGIVMIPYFARVQLQESGSLPEDLKLSVEGEPRIDTVVPSLRSFFEPRRYGEKVFAAAPDSSLVVGKWKEIMVLYYFRYAERKREDLTLDPYDPAHYIRLNRWQDRHEMSTHPIVFLRHPSELGIDVGAVDTVEVFEGQRLFVRKAPFEPLKPPARPFARQQ